MSPVWFLAILIPLAAFVTTLTLGVIASYHHSKLEKGYMVGALIAEVVMFGVLFAAMWTT